MMALLVEFGADIHATDGLGDPPAPEGIVCDAAGAGALNAVRWLVERGATVNYQVQGATRCFNLVGAVNGGHLDVVQYLVEKAGADINAVWIDMNPLSHAIMFNRKAIEAYLRSKGAKEPEKRE
jgi:ankyrin repeat protein